MINLLTLEQPDAPNPIELTPIGIVRNARSLSRMVAVSDVTLCLLHFGNVRLFRKFPNDDLDHFQSSNVIYFQSIDFYSRGFLSDPK